MRSSRSSSAFHIMQIPEMFAPTIRACVYVMCVSVCVCTRSYPHVVVVPELFGIFAALVFPICVHIWYS